MPVRKFVESDREALRRVYLDTRLQSFTWLDGNGLALADFDADTEGERIWVYDSGAELVGFVSADVANNFIHHLFILPHWARQGVGSRLLQACLDDIGYPTRLKCVSANSAALAFYQSRGWKTCAREMGADGEYHLMEIAGCSD